MSSSLMRRAAFCNKDQIFRTPQPRRRRAARLSLNQVCIEQFADCSFEKHRPALIRVPLWLRNTIPKAS